jgi:hypothetical protein
MRRAVDGCTDCFGVGLLGELTVYGMVGRGLAGSAVYWHSCQAIQLTWPPYKISLEIIFSIAWVPHVAVSS